jgi:DNA-binding response OmpR family regulator
MTDNGRERPKRHYRPDDEVRQRGRVVLVVDDVGMMRHAVSEVVRDLGYEPVEAAGGEEANALADFYEPRLIVLDIQMPGADGLVTLERMRDNPKLADTPVIMLTVESQRESFQTAIGLGALDYLVKPVSADLLKERMRALLEPEG